MQRILKGSSPLVTKTRAPYMLFDEAKVCFFVLLQCLKGCCPPMQKQSLRSVGGPLTRPDGVQGEIFIRIRTEACDT